MENDIQTLYMKVKQMEDQLQSLTKGAWALVIAITGWALVQLYMENERNIQLLQYRPTIVQTR
jgi:hypothetical protein